MSICCLRVGDVSPRCHPWAKVQLQWVLVNNLLLWFKRRVIAPHPQHRAGDCCGGGERLSLGANVSPLCLHHGAGGLCCAEGREEGSFQTFHHQTPLLMALGQKQSLQRDPTWYQSFAVSSPLPPDRVPLLSHSPGTSPASAAPSVARAWSPPPWQTKMGRSTAKVCATSPALWGGAGGSLGSAPLQLPWMLGVEV